MAVAARTVVGHVIEAEHGKAAERRVAREERLDLRGQRSFHETENRAAERIRQMLPAGLRVRPAALFRASAYQDPRRVQSRQPGQAFASFLTPKFRDSMMQ